MSVNPSHPREDIEEQFAIPDLPPRMTANRTKDFEALRRMRSRTMPLHRLESL
ncbi:hypothetical protein Rleg5DRAFT_6238 [Rhizobium leguminosarum bv. viciae WSM1455]|nr:hypothetical protein Rleg5DRAFT_6238 [Rhizobium leguminosarum bv. viciae WSM1455]